MGTNAQELLASPRLGALAALQAQADRHGLLHEVFPRLREDPVGGEETDAGVLERKLGGQRSAMS